MSQTVLVTGTDAVSLEVDGLLLDCDGVLVDSHSAAADCLESLGEALGTGFRLSTAMSSTDRRITDLVAELISTPSDVAAAAADLTQQELDHAADVVAIPGARQLLDSSPAGKLGGRHVRRPCHSHRPHGIGRPSPRGRTGHKRRRRTRENPSPTPTCSPHSACGVSPQRCAVFEDAPAGIAAARAAGVATIIGVGADRLPLPVSPWPLRICAASASTDTVCASTPGRSCHPAASRLTISLQEVLMRVPNQMRRVVVSPNSIDVVESPTPEPMSGEVLVHSVVSGVCGSDTHAAQWTTPVHRSAVPPGSRSRRRDRGTGTWRRRYRGGSTGHRRARPSVLGLQAMPPRHAESL